MKTDFELRHDVERELEEDPSVDARDIAVTAKNGVVTLTGHVPTLGEKWRAESIAKRVAGVVAIANEIEVELMHERTDADIAEDLRLAFKMDNRVPADSIKVAVSNGWVTLEGTVNHHFQKAEAENLARELAGVRGITNSDRHHAERIAQGSQSKDRRSFQAKRANRREPHFGGEPQRQGNSHWHRPLVRGARRSRSGSLAHAGRHRGGKQADRQTVSFRDERAN